MLKLDHIAVPIQLAKTPEHAQFRACLLELSQILNSLCMVRLSYLEMIKLVLLMKEIDKNCLPLRLEAKATLETTDLPSNQAERHYNRIIALAAIRPLIDDAQKLAMEGKTGLPIVILKSSQHPDHEYGQYGVLIKIQAMISTYIGLVNLLVSTQPNRKDRLAVALSLLPDERDFYHFVAVSRSEYTGR